MVISTCGRELFYLLCFYSVRGCIRFRSTTGITYDNHMIASREDIRTEGHNRIGTIAVKALLSHSATKVKPCFPA